MAKWLNRTAGVAARNGTTSHTITFTAATSGSFLVAVVGGAVTHTWPGGWTEQLQPVNNTELSVATKTASAAESSVTITHNGSNYPVIYVIYEFPSGTTWGVSNSGTGTSNVGLTGVTVGDTVYSAFNWSVAAGTSSSSGFTSVWTTPDTEDLDQFEPGNGVTDGAYMSVAYQDNYPSTTMTPAGTGLIPGGSGRESVAFSLNVPAGGDTTPPSVPTGLQTTAIGTTTADLSWNASTDNVGVTGYEVVIVGP